MSPGLDMIIARGDLADLALFLWASGASTALALVLRQLGEANRRFDEFIRQLHQFNSHWDG
ncbi:MAG: hypothetical protein EBS72_15770 [Rhizobiales bacterium]|nr:hypothetical protein [Hyphomicrobiales bacterium]